MLDLVVVPAIFLLAFTAVCAVAAHLTYRP
jgi:hypothetical protein